MKMLQNDKIVFIIVYALVNAASRSNRVSDIPHPIGNTNAR